MLTFVARKTVDPARDDSGVLLSDITITVTLPLISSKASTLPPSTVADVGATNVQLINQYSILYFSLSYVTFEP